MSESAQPEPGAAPSTPPGWYEGGIAGEQRWWDGVAWTAHARPTPPAPAPKGTVPNPFWHGNKEGSLSAAILCTVLAIPTFFATIFTTMTTGFAGVVPGLAFLAFLAFAILMFLNWNGLRKNEQIVRQQQAGQPLVVPHPPHD